MMSSKEFKLKRNVTICRLTRHGVTDAVIASAFGLSKSYVSRLPYDPQIEDIIRKEERLKKPVPAKRLSLKEAEVAFANLSVHASNRLHDETNTHCQVWTLDDFIVWWKRKDEVARSQHHDVIYGSSAMHVPLKCGVELMRLAIGVGLKKNPPM